MKRSLAVCAWILLLVVIVPLIAATVSLSGVTGLTEGSGITLTLSAPNIIIALNTAYVPSHAMLQAGKDLFCDSPNTNPANTYTCSLSASAVLTVYTTGAAFLLRPGVSSTAGSTLNIDNLGLKTIFQKDGTSQITTQLTAGQAQWVWYDGTNFRLMY